jgi:predicted TIM-barrel fold metal-dependent hydrolase
MAVLSNAGSVQGVLDPAAGADELERAVRQLGMKGAMLFGTTNGEYLDDDRFAPFWKRVEALGCPTYLHAADAPIVLQKILVGSDLLQCRKVRRSQDNIDAPSVRA